jgi:hypothetical protein
MRRKYLTLFLTFNLISLFLFANSNSIKFTQSKNNGIRVSPNSSLNLTNCGTIEAWIYLNSYANFAGIIHKGDKKDFSDEAYTLQLWNNNKLYFALVNGSSSRNIQSNVLLNTDQWYHVSASWNSSGMYLYLNGKMVASSTNSMSLSYSNLTDPDKNGLNIGRQLNEDYNSTYNKFTFDGYIDEVRIWKSCLSSYQIQKRQFKELNSSDSLWGQLVGYWPFNEGSGTSAYDASSNSNTGDFIPTNSNKPRWKTKLFPEVLTWKGNSSRDWTDVDNWKESILPHGFADVEIASNASNMPEIKNQDMHCGSLLIPKSKYLSIASGKSLKIWGDVHIQSDNQKTGALINKGTLNIVGTAIFEREIVSDGWHYVSSPVANASSNTFWGTALYSYNEGSGTWSKLSNNQTLNAMQGYDVYVQANNKVVSFYGQLNSGNFSQNLSYSKDGYNLIGNPYPATIDWDARSGWTKTNINGSVYIWDPQKNNFSTYNNGSSTNGGSQYIAPTQGFFVRANTGGGVIAMTPDVMVESPAGKFRSPDKGMQISLQVEGNNRSDETIVRFHTFADMSFDNELDAYKVYSYTTDVPQIYSVLEDGTEVSINSLPHSIECSSIPVHFRTPADGQYSIKFMMEGFPIDMEIYLEDLFTQTVHDLRSGSYLFHAEVTDPTNRFVVHVSPASSIENETSQTTAIDSDKRKEIKAFVSNQSLFVDTRSSKYEHAQINIYNMLGKSMMKKTIETKDIHQYKLNYKSGYYFVEITTKEEANVIKVFLN